MYQNILFVHNSINKTGKTLQELVGRIDAVFIAELQVLGEVSQHSAPL